MSLLNWGESSQGEWTLQIADLRANATGVVKAARLDLFGTDAPDQTRPWLAISGFEGGRFQLRMTAQPGYRYEVQASTNLSDWTTLLATNLTSASTVELKEESVAAFQGRYFRAVRQPSAP